MADDSAKKIVLITGANSGIGLELATQLLTRSPSYHVLLASRSASKGAAALDALRSRGDLQGSLEALPLDLGSDASISAAAEAISSSHGRLDILVNNAGVSSTSPSARERFAANFDTNAAGPAILTSALAPLLRAAATRSPGGVRVVNVSSGAGSLARYADPDTRAYPEELVAYQASKAALNMVTLVQHRELGREGVRVFAFCPGFTASNLNAGTTEGNGAQKVGDAVRPLVAIVEGERDGEVGRFLRAKGEFGW